MTSIMRSGENLQLVLQLLLIYLTTLTPSVSAAFHTNVRRSTDDARATSTITRMRMATHRHRPAAAASVDDDDDQLDKNAVFDHQRRRALSVSANILLTTTAANSYSLPTVAAQAQATLLQQQQQADSMQLENGLLNGRVTENVLSPPPYGMEGSGDVLYPSWMAGTWKVESTTGAVQAPCGTSLFGGQAALQKALNEIGTTLTYSCRFLKIQQQDDNNNNEERCIADREYNVQSLAKAAMGENSYVSTILSSPNQFSCLMAPPSSSSNDVGSGLLQVDLLVLKRRQEDISATEFDCAEVVCEIVSRASSGSAAATSVAAAPRLALKEVETVSLYTKLDSNNRITCRQRTAIFLRPSQSSPQAMQAWQASRGRPVDVRFYDVVYTRPTKK